LPLSPNGNGGEGVGSNIGPKSVMYYLNGPLRHKKGKGKKYLTYQKGEKRKKNNLMKKKHINV